MASSPVSSAVGSAPTCGARLRETMTTAPPNPRTRPASLLTVIGSSCRTSPARTRAKSGVSAWRMVASAGVDRLLGPGDEGEGDGDIEDAHHGQPAEHGQVARHARSRQDDQRRQADDADGQAPADERERLEAALDADLDEEVGAAPGDADTEEDEPEEREEEDRAGIGLGSGGLELGRSSVVVG